MNYQQVQTIHGRTIHAMLTLCKRICVQDMKPNADDFFLSLALTLRSKERITGWNSTNPDGLCKLFCHVSLENQISEVFSQALQLYLLMLSDNLCFVRRQNSFCRIKYWLHYFLVFSFCWNERNSFTYKPLWALRMLQTPVKIWHSRKQNNDRCFYCPRHLMCEL